MLQNALEQRGIGGGRGSITGAGAGAGSGTETGCIPRAFLARPGNGLGFVGNGFSGFFAGANAGKLSIEDTLVWFEWDAVVAVEDPDRELPFPFACTPDASAGKFSLDNGLSCFDRDELVIVEGPARELPFPFDCTDGLGAPYADSSIIISSSYLPTTL